MGKTSSGIPSRRRPGVNVLFIAKSGFTTSFGIDTNFKADGGINVDPVFGFGYVYKRSFYVGGILNVIPKPYFFDKRIINVGSEQYVRYEDSSTTTDIFIAPTFVIGYDFGGFVLGWQMSYMSGADSKTSGIRFSFGAGVSVGSLF